ncbi:MAG: exonuclease SbcCD subunit D [Pirellulales bacterium]
MPVRILATGDIHIGRRPTRLPETELAERASAARMWEAIVSHAIAEQVDAVVLSGDIVDHDNRFYEATGPLERGILKLADASIPTYAVAGNHDWDVFPRILEQLDTPLFHFLGRGGCWEETYLERDGHRLLQIVGWSFPARHVRQSPLLDFQLASDPNVPTVGLLHADVDVPASEYGPVRLSELRACDLTLWVLGHIHKPQHWPSEGGASALYPGSPQALGPNETGPHGPWLIEFEGLHSVECRQIPMSLVRYDECDVDLEDADTSDAFDTKINEVLSAALEKVAGDDEPPQLLSLRLNFVGATLLCGRIDSLAKELDDLERSRSGVRARVDKCANLTQPVIDLEELAQRNDPAGVLARTLIALERNEEEESLAALTRDAVAHLQEVHRAAAYAALVDRDPTPDHETSRQILIQQGRQLLEALQAQVPQRQESPA